MTDRSADNLYQSANVAGLDLPNRFVMAPMTRGFSPNGIPPAETVDYYRRRAEGGVGLIISEGIAIDHPTASQTSNIPFLHGDAAVERWTGVVQAVHEAGSRFIPQLWHVGVTYNPADNPGRGKAALGPSGVSGSSSYPDGEQASEQQIEAMIEAYARAAVAAMECGCDGIELHGAHGYLIDSFLWERTNLRTDAWGGDIAGRTRFAVEIIRECRRRTAPDFPILFRFSQWKLQDYAARLAETPEELEALLTPLAEAGVDVFHASQRRYWETEFGSDMNLAAWTKKITGRPVITVGSVGLKTELFDSYNPGKISELDNLDTLYRMYERGDFDLVAVGRALISDPAWVRKARHNDYANMRSYSVDMLQTLV